MTTDNIGSTQYSYGSNQALSTNADGSFQVALDPGKNYTDILLSPGAVISNLVVSYRPSGAGAPFTSPSNVIGCSREMTLLALVK